MSQTWVFLMHCLCKQMCVLAIIVLNGCDAQSPSDVILPSATLPQSDQKRDPEFFSRMDRWYAIHLAAMKEPLLSTNEWGSNSDLFRFLYLPSFDHPIVIRIEKTGDEVTLVSKRLSGKGG
ncbi:MAG: hypothetical protein P8K78_03905 [Pirellulales bacterium]|nr:hypothetical protein [Pirellulales bacterium]